MGMTGIRKTRTRLIRSWRNLTRTRVRSLAKCERGATIVMFALMFPVAAVVVGMALDYGRVQDARTASANALDSALLNVGKELSVGATSEKNAPARVTELFNEILPNSAPDYTTIDSVSTVVDKTNGVVSATVNGRTPAALGGLFGIDEMDFEVEASVNYNTLTVELSMVLDVTGSMSGSKLRDLKAAAEDLVTILMPETEASSDKVRIALAPYANSVNTGDYRDEVTGSWGKACVIERSGKGKFNDKPPSTALFSTTWSCPNAKIQPLTDDKDSLLSQIDSYSASGMTAGHLGIAWGWYMLSPLWSDVWPAESTPAAYDEKNLIKVLIVMTDGEFNQWYVSANGSSSTQAEKLCTKAKNKGVIIYSVAFQAPGSAQTLLKNCATSSDNHYFSASTGQALKDAFEAIAIQIRNLRLSS